MADYDGCFDSLFRFSPAVAGQSEDETKAKSDLARYSFGAVKPEDQEHIEALQAWLVQKTSGASRTMLFCGSNRQSKKADLAVNAFKINPREGYPMGKYPSMTKWIQDQKLNEGFTGLCLKDYECLASVPGTVLPGYGGQPWWLVPSLLEDRLTGAKEGSEWGRRDNVSAEGAVTKFGQIDAHKDEGKTELEQPVVVEFGLFDTVTYHMKVPKKQKKPEEQLQKLAIMRHQLESMASHVASRPTSYKSITVYYIDDRMDLLNHVGPNIGIEGNAKFANKLAAKAESVTFHTVNFVWKGDDGDRVKPTIKHTASTISA